MWDTTSVFLLRGGGNVKPDSGCRMKESGKLPESTPHLERIVGVNQLKTQWYRKQSQIYSMGGLVAHGSEISTRGRAITRIFWCEIMKSKLKQVELFLWVTVYWPHKQGKKQPVIRAQTVNPFSTCLLSVHCVPGTKGETRQAQSLLCGACNIADSRDPHSHESGWLCSDATHTQTPSSSIRSR